MPDEASILRERAAHAREIAKQINHPEAVRGLLHFAEEKEAKAAALEAASVLPVAATIPAGEPPIARAGAALKPPAQPEPESAELDS